MSAQPKFLFGLKTDVRNNIHFLDDSRIVYPCGHNVVIYNHDDRSQICIPGIEGSEGITALALSVSKKFLAVCEKAEKAICLIYELQGIGHIPPQIPKRRKILTRQDYNSKEFGSVCFSQSNEKNYLATLSLPYRDREGVMNGDCKAIIWLWDKSRCHAITSVPFGAGVLPNQISFSNYDHNILLVTGQNTFKYLKVTDNHSLKCVHQ